MGFHVFRRLDAGLGRERKRGRKEASLDVVVAGGEREMGWLRRGAWVHGGWFMKTLQTSTCNCHLGYINPFSSESFHHVRREDPNVNIVSMWLVSLTESVVLEGEASLSESHYAQPQVGKESLSSFYRWNSWNCKRLYHLFDLSLKTISWICFWIWHLWNFTGYHICLLPPSTQPEPYSLVSYLLSFSPHFQDFQTLPPKIFLWNIICKYKNIYKQRECSGSLT